MKTALILTGILLIFAIFLLIAGVIIQWRRNDNFLKEIDEFLERAAPEGYEDEEGFHYGKK